MSLDVDGMVGAVRKAQTVLYSSSEPELAEALRPALNVAYFLLDGHGPNFDDYLSAFARDGLSFLGSFASREAFDAWLMTQTAHPLSGTLSVDGAHHVLGFSRAKGEPFLLALPSVEGLRRPARWEEQARLWPALDKAHSALTSLAEPVEGLLSATLALHFVTESGCTRDFVHFLGHLDEPFPPLLFFTTRDEAESWLKHHPRPPHGASVRVGDDLFTVGYQRERNQRVLVRFPRDE